MRLLFAALALVALAGIAPVASAGDSIPHFRASHQNGGVHFRASHGDRLGHQRVLISNSRCGGPVFVTTWQPQHRLYHSGFVHFSRPMIVSTPGIIPSSRGWRGSCGGFYHGQFAPRHLGSVHAYNGSIGSDNAGKREINWQKRSRVHSPKLSPSRGD